MTTNNRIIDVTNCPKISSYIIMETKLANNVIKGYGVINGRVQSYVQNCNDVFDKGFKMLQLLFQAKTL